MIQLKHIGQFVKIPGKDFECATTLVTQELWLEVMGNNPSNFKGEANLPVEMVSWNDCQEFIKKLNDSQKEFVYRLPHETEWEYCCRAGSTTEYCFGDEEDKLKDYAWYYKNSDNKTHPVGLKKPNAYGLFDVHGNLWEWTSSPEGSYRVIRGGCWSNGAEDLRSAFRYYASPSYRYDDVGVRLVRDIVSLGPLTLLPSEASEPERKRSESEASGRIPWRLRIAIAMKVRHPSFSVKECFKFADSLIAEHERTKK